MPRVSIVIPTFNRASTLPRAITSVLQQTFKDFDLWIIDDGSTDHTEKLMETWSKNKIHYIKQKNFGVSTARNSGIKLSTGEWLAFLDSDDEWLPQKLQKQFDFIERYPKIPLVHGEEIWVRNGKRVNAKHIHQKFGGSIFQKCLALCLISPSAAIMQRSLLAEVGAWDEEFIVCEDYDLWLKITAKHEVGFISDPLIKKYGGHADQLSGKYKAMDFWRIKAMKNILENGLLDSGDIKAVKNEMQKKGEILLNGYKKHNNMENYTLVKKWLET